MYKCEVCGHAQEGAGEHCGQPMVKSESGGAPDQPTPTGPSAPAEPSEPSESSEGSEEKPVM